MTAHLLRHKGTHQTGYRTLFDHINSRIDALRASGELEAMLYSVPVAED